MVGKIVIIVGLVIVVVGALLWLIEGLSGRAIGTLPGDVHVRRGNFTFYFPLATCVLLSIVLTLVLSVLARRR
jgi:hypothetical protein